MTLEEAKEQYMKFDCSEYGIFRDGYGYSDYLKLNISKEQKRKWEDELFDSLLKQLQKNGTYDIFNRMYRVATNQKTQKQLYTLKEALRLINYVYTEIEIENLKLKSEASKVRAIVAETILGRGAIHQRSGMIFWAYDSGEIEMAADLLHNVIDLLNISDSSEEIKKRIERDLNTARKIDLELGLGVFD